MVFSIRFAAGDRGGIERASSYLLDAIGPGSMPRELLKRGRIDMHLGKTHGNAARIVNFMVSQPCQFFPETCIGFSQRFNLPACAF
jgi:hypothetical protein